MHKADEHDVTSARFCLDRASRRKLDVFQLAHFHHVVLDHDIVNLETRRVLDRSAEQAIRCGAAVLDDEIPRADLRSLRRRARPGV
jgi:hypothetical protein